ncbi:MAG: bifunctional phosphoribosylaminoimidazolecarboxamide formyltransferase/IMP cyclohydrolase [Planctomycetaceae bacterium]
MSDALPRRALVSVSDKTGLAPFVSELVELGFEIISTGGTRRHLEEAGVPVIGISEYTGFPEIMEGRVKTLHPKVHGAILGRPDLPGDAAAISDHDIVPFTLVVCNLYPFEETIARPEVTVSEAIEQIDIGGPSMVRSAAKNHAYVGIVTRPEQYPRVLEALGRDTLDENHRRELAAAAFEMTAAYDRAIADYMSGLDAGEAPATDETPLTITVSSRATLRYGENPHQQGSWFVEPDADPATLAAAEILGGKELSYNNLLDIDAALSIVREFTEPAAVVIKHNNPCGCAVGTTQAAAFTAAYAGDTVSAFGSILGFNQPLALETAEMLCEPGRFIEAIIAPDYEDAAFEALTTRPKWKNNVRLLKLDALNSPRDAGPEYRRVSGGLLVQDRDEGPEPLDQWQTVSERPPTESELSDLHFAWAVAKHVKSNAIVFAKNRALVGVGAGQMSRLDSVHIAHRKAGDRSQGAAMASDAFFPFRDGLDQAAAAGITAVAQPGGSRGDDSVIQACNEHNLAMVFTGRRHFKH